MNFCVNQLIKTGDCSNESGNAKASIANLIKIFNIIPLTENDCSEALSLPIHDFEDAIIAVCAQKINADCIVSRDEKFIKTTTSIDVIMPKQLIERVKVS